MPAKPNNPAPRRKQPRTPAAARGERVLVGAAVLALAAAVAVWLVQVHLPIRRVEVVGAEQVSRAEVLAAARVDTALALYSVDKAVLEDRVAGLPWVREARCQRVPDGTLRIRVFERAPVLLALDGRGRPRAYLDAEGYRMPVRPGMAFRTPLLRGLKLPAEGRAPLEHPAVRDLLAALAAAPEPTRALLSDFELDGRHGLRLNTVLYNPRRGLRVQLGHGAYAEKFERLAAFWHQVVLPQPGKDFGPVDLRFDGQIVTQEIAINHGAANDGSASELEQP